MLSLVARWLVAVSAMATSMVIPFVIYAILRAWDHRRSERFWAGLVNEPVVHDDSVVYALAELRELLAVGLLWWLALTSVLVARRRSSGSWTRVLGWFSIMGYFFVALGSVVTFNRNLGGSVGFVLGPLALVATVMVCWSLHRLAVLAVTQPVTSGLIRSGLEIPFRVRGQRARLRIQHDRVVMDHFTSRFKRGRATALSLDELRVVGFGELAKASSLTMVVDSPIDILGESVRLPLSPGPALWLVGSTRQWVVPLHERDGRRAVAIIERRRTIRDEFVDPDAYRESRGARLAKWDEARSARMHVIQLDLSRRERRRRNPHEWRRAEFDGISKLVAVTGFCLSMLLGSLVMLWGELLGYGGGPGRVDYIIWTGSFGLVVAPLSWFPIRRLRNYFRASRHLEANPVQPSLNLMPVGIPSRPSVAGWTALTTNARSVPGKLGAGVR